MRRYFLLVVSTSKSSPSDMIPCKDSKASARRRRHAVGYEAATSWQISRNELFVLVGLCCSGGPLLHEHGKLPLLCWHCFWPVLENFDVGEMREAPINLQADVDLDGSPGGPGRMLVRLGSSQSNFNQNYHGRESIPLISA